MCHQAGWWLTRRVESVGVARGLVADQFGLWGLVGDDVGFSAVDDVQLVVSELDTNAVRFSTGDVVLSIGAHREWLGVTVTDNSDAQVRHLAPDSGSLGGRGIALVEAVSRIWGQDRLAGGGKTVWACIDLASGSALGRLCRL